MNMKNFNRSQIPPAQAPRAFNFPVFKRFRLKNGLQVVYAPHTKLPMLAIQLVIHSAANYDPQGKEGIASFTADMLPEGTTDRSSYDISSAFEDLGTQFNTHAGWNVTYLEMVVLKKQLLASMDLFCDVLYHPAFDNQEIDRLKKQLLHQRLRVVDNAGQIAQEKLGQVIFPDTRYSLPAIGESRHIKKFVQNDMQDFYGKYFLPRNATFIIVGDIDFNSAKKLAEDHFNDWQDKSFKKFAEPEFKINSQQKVYLVHKPDAQQAEIRMGHLGIDRQNPDYFAAILANQIFGGYFLSRLNLNLREDKGFTYGIHSRFVSRKVKGPFQISSAIETQYVFEAVQEIIKEMQKLREEKVTEVELQHAKGYLTGIFPIAFESCPQIAAGLSGIVEYGLDDDYYRTYRDKMMAVTREEIFDAAQKYLHPESLSIVVCTDTSALKDKFKSAFDVETSEYKAES